MQQCWALGRATRRTQHSCQHYYDDFYDCVSLGQQVIHRRKLKQWLCRYSSTTENGLPVTQENDIPSKLQQQHTRLTPAHLRDTLTILRPQYWHLSPIWGAVLQKQTTLLANLRSWHAFMNVVNSNKDSNENKDNSSSSHHISYTQAPKLAQQLFFQPHAGATMRVTKTKSLPAAYLTPTQLGKLVGCHQQMMITTAEQSKASSFMGYAYHASTMANLVREHCQIRSNHLNDQWTGVSMARWHELLQILPPMSLDAYETPSNLQQGSLDSDCRCNHFLLGNVLTSLVWSTAVWDLCQSKQDVFDYYQAIQDISGKEILLSKKELLNHGFHMKDDRLDSSSWETSHFPESELALDAVDADLDQILQILHSSATATVETNENSEDDQTKVQVAQSLERVAAYLAHTSGGGNANSTAIPKPPVPHKKYSFDKGAAKPDCVEMTVREVIEFLLWDETRGVWDLQRLPKAADERLVNVLHEQVNLHQRNALYISEDMGQQWHTLLSNLPGCEYLTVSPFGRPYELSPKLENVARVCQLLLYPPSSSTNSQPTLTWKTLRDLQHQWNQDHADPAIHLQTATGTLTERVAISRHLLEHENTTMHLASGHHAIELRLRYEESAHTGFATVTHIHNWKQSDDRNATLVLGSKRSDKGSVPAANQDEKRDGRLGNLLRSLHLTLQSSSSSPGYDQTWSIPLVICLLGNLGLKNLHDLKQNDLVGPLRGSFLISLLTHHYRLDRRKMMQLATESEEGVYEKALEGSQQVLQNAVLRICDITAKEPNDDDKSGDRAKGEDDFWLDLLGWILTETPQAESDNAVFAPSLAGVSFDPALEKALLSLPPENTSIHCGLEKSEWVGNGKLIARVLKWKNGDLSLSRVFRYQTWSDSWTLAKFMMDSQNEKTNKRP